MDILILIGIGIVGALLVVLIFRTAQEPKESEGSLLLQQQVEALRKTLDDKLSESSKLTSDVLQKQLSESQKLMSNISDSMTKHLVEVSRGVAQTSEATKQVFKITDQLHDLEKVLKHQKQRGNLGEASLRLSLENILSPDAFTMQYQFKDGDQVDAVIRTKEGLIAVDAKFSLDNYNRLIQETDDKRRMELEKEFRNDLKKRIDETSKYIKQKENTLPFAFMFIPAEGIYYDLLVNEVGAIKVNTRSLIDYAYNEKKVIIVSPTTFTAYLQSVLYGFKAFKIEKDAKEIQKNVLKLEKHLRSYHSFFMKLGKSLGTTVSHFTSAHKEFKKIDTDVTKISGKTVGVKEISLERPLLEEERD